MKVRLKPVSQDVPLEFLCNFVFGVLGFSPENCESVVKEKGFLEIELDTESYERLREAVQKYQFLSLDVLTDRAKVHMAVALTDKHVPASLACNILSGLAGFRLQGCEENFRVGKEVYIEVDEEKAGILLKSAETYPFLSFRIVSGEIPSTGIPDRDANLFSESWQLLKRNAGFFTAYMFLLVLIAVISIVPVLGFFFSILFGLYFYSGILYVAVHHLSGRSKRNILQLSGLWEYFVPALGMYLGGIFLFLIGILILLTLALLFGGFGLLSDLHLMEEYGKYRVGPGMTSSMLALFFVYILLVLYYIYTLPLVYTKAIQEGLSFKAGFLSTFYPFTPQGFQDAFSNRYFKLVMYMWFVFTVGFLLAILAFITVVFIPVALALFAWLLTYFALTVGEYLRGRYKPAL